MTLDQLAEAAEVSPSHLSRLERSQTLPSFPVMAKIAEALDVDVNEFVRLEHDVTHLDDELSWYLDLWALPDDVNQEFFGLTIEARRALVSCLDRLTVLNLTPYTVQEQVERALVSGGDDPDLATLAPLIERAGMDCVGLTHALYLLNVLVGPQSALIAGPSLLPIVPGNDLLAPYRLAFPSAPLDPFVGQWWRQSNEIGSGRSSAERPSRIVVGVQALASPLGPAIARSVRSIIDQDELVEVAVTERQLGSVNLLISGDHAVAEQLVSRRGAKGSSHVALWLNSARTISSLDAVVSRIWDGISSSERDPATVRERLQELNSAST
jgi:DNA-binding XRE family transcriptional regulator